MTQSLEDYLEMVSFLAEEGDGEVRLTDIASRLRVTKPSVFTALKILKNQGLLEHARYRTISLTEKGAAVAAKIRDRHRLLTTFLTSVVGVSLDIAEKDACKMDHLLSEETLEKIKTIVRGGNTIPGAV